MSTPRRAVALLTLSVLMVVWGSTFVIMAGVERAKIAHPVGNLGTVSTVHARHANY